jgi:Tfp pilus assembly PilM family ATPase
MKKQNQDGLYAVFDIGSNAIKAAVLEITNGNKRLATIEKVELKPFNEFPDEIEHRNHVRESLKSLSERIPLKECTKVSSLFYHRELQVKIIELPNQIESDQIEKILNWESKKLLSPNYREEPYTFAYKILHQRPYKVALAVIPQHILETFSSLFEEAGIKLTGAFSEVFASHSLKELTDHTGLPALSIANMGQNGTHVQIFSSGELKFYRFIPSGLAEFSTPPQEKEMEVYAQKIRFSFDYFRAVSKLAQIDALFFMGGGPAKANFLPFIRSYFSPTRVGIVDISSGIDISPILPELSDNSVNEEKQRNLLSFLPAIGAILSHLEDDDNCTNLAGRLETKKAKEKLEQLSKQLPLWIGAIGIVLIAAIIFVMSSGRKATLKEAVNQLETEKTMVQATNIKIARYNTNTSQKLRLSPAGRKALKPILKDHLSGAEILFHIASSRPKTITLKEILIRSSANAENINLENQSSEVTPQPGMATSMIPNESTESNEDQYSSRFSQLDGQTDEGLTGETLVIYGFAENNKTLSEFTEKLIKKRVIKRVSSINSRKTPAKTFEFLVKGEL